MCETQKEKKFVQEGKKLACPVCGSDEDIYRPEIMPILTPVKVDEDGRWDWADELYSTWPEMISEKDPDFEEEWYCRDCGIHFDAPNVKNVSEEDDNEE